MSDTETPIEIPEEVPEIDPIQVIHEGQCESLSGRSTLTFSVGRHPDTGALHLRIVGNTGGGMWCDEWIPGSEIDAVVIGDPELTSRSFQVLKPNRRYVFTGYATEMAQDADVALTAAARRRHQPTINPSERRPAIPSAAVGSAALCWR